MLPLLRAFRAVGSVLPAPFCATVVTVPGRLTTIAGGLAVAFFAGAMLVLGNKCMMYAS